VTKEKAEEVLEKAKGMEAGEKHFVEELKKGKTFGETHRKTGTL
jgi:regulator of RNase E activity RraA